MIKMINLLKRHPDLSMEEFIEHYETVHRKIGEKWLSKFAVKYVRRYLREVPESVYPGKMLRNYDVVMEIWFPDRKAFEDCFAVLVTEEAQAEIRPDEDRLFDRENMHFFIAEEHESDLSSVDDRTSTDRRVARPGETKPRRDGGVSRVAVRGEQDPACQAGFCECSDQNLIQFTSMPISLGARFCAKRHSVPGAGSVAVGRTGLTT